MKIISNQYNYENRYLTKLFVTIEKKVKYSKRKNKTFECITKCNKP